MHTSLLLVALLGPGAAPEASEAPSWKASYSAGLAACREQGKPVAVFVGQGPTGWQKVSTDGVSAEARKALAANYVCVYVDASQPQGQTLANAFEIGSGTGLVLSTKDGVSQAFSHDGSMSSADLERSLTRYATGPAITQTERLASARVAYSVNPSNAISTAAVAAGTVIPATAGTYTLAPSVGMTYAPAVAGTMYYPSYAPTYAATVASPAFAPSYHSHGYAPSYSYGGGCPGGRCGR